MVERKDKALRDAERLRQAQLKANIARLHSRGQTTAQIAQTLEISVTTVTNHLDAALQRIVKDQQIMFEGEEQLLERYPRPQAENDLIRVAYEMRLTGLSYYEIGQHLSVTDTTVERWIAKEITRLEADTLISAERARRLELDRLDRMLAVVTNQALMGSLDAVKVSLAISKRRSELLGLDAPTKINLEQQVREMARANGLDEEEAVLEAAQIMKSYRK